MVEDRCLVSRGKARERVLVSSLREAVSRESGRRIRAYHPTSAGFASNLRPSSVLPEPTDPIQPPSRRSQGAVPPRSTPGRPDLKRLTSGRGLLPFSTPAQKAGPEESTRMES